LKASPKEGGIVPMPTFAIVSEKSNKALDVPSGSPEDALPIQQYTFNGGQNQRWNLVRYSDQPFFQIVSVATAKVLTVLDTSLEDGAQVCQFSPSDNPGQAWKLVLVGVRSEGAGLLFAFKIVAVHSGKVLDVRGASTEDHAVIQQYSDNGGANQIWWLEAQS
jgi:hypothetical protein